MLDCDPCHRKKVRVREIALAAGEMGASCNVNHDGGDRNKCQLCRRTGSEPGGCGGRTFQVGETTEQYLKMGVRSGVPVCTNVHRTSESPKWQEC